VRSHLCAKADDGERYVCAKDIAREMDANSHRVGNALGMLADEGLVEMWSSGTTGATWELTIDE
jgi:Mn-dependent DtxR family transcriptional regulator